MEGKVGVYSQVWTGANSKFFSRQKVKHKMTLKGVLSTDFIFTVRNPIIGRSIKSYVIIKQSPNQTIKLKNQILLPSFRRIQELITIIYPSRRNAMPYRIINRGFYQIVLSDICPSIRMLTGICYVDELRMLKIATIQTNCANYFLR